MTSAAIYCRISRDRVGAGLGVDRQEADCRALAARLGYAVSGVYVDNDLSAYSGKPRPEYRRMLADIAAGSVAAVIVWHTDRLHRRPVELEEYIGVCDVRAVATHTVQAGVLDMSTATGRMQARISAAVARHEVEHQIERQQTAKRQAAAAGQWNGGRRPYGYEADGMTVRPAEAAAVASATDSVLLGVSLRAEAARLNKAGLVTSTGRAWKPTELRKVLLRARNAGLREHKGTEHPAAWPALVTEDKWRAVRSMLTDQKRRTTDSPARRWMLSNIAVCGSCGSTLRVSMMARSSVPSYMCSASKCVVRNAAELEHLVSQIIIARLSRPDALSVFRPRAAEVDVTGLRAEVNALRQRLDDLATNLELDERTLALRAEALRGRIGELEERLAQAARPGVLDDLLHSCDVEDAWDRLGLDRRRAVVKELMTVTVNKVRKGRPPGWKPGQSYFNPEGIVIDWKTV